MKYTPLVFIFIHVITAASLYHLPPVVVIDILSSLSTVEVVDNLSSLSPVEVVDNLSSPLSPF